MDIYLELAMYTRLITGLGCAKIDWKGCTWEAGPIDFTP